MVSYSPKAFDLFALASLSLLLATRTQAEMPPADTQYPVGRTDVAMMDMSRKDVLGADVSLNRRIVMTLYYPAAPGKGTHYAPYAAGEELSAAVAEMGVPQHVLTSFFQPHAFLNCPVSKKQRRFPILIFSPGWGTMPLCYSNLLERVASQGYIIAAISHTDSTDYTVFPDGKVVIATRLGSDPDKYAHGDAELYAARRKVGAVWLGDVKLVLDHLVRMSSDDARFKGRLDLRRIGMFGHSFGGAVAAQAEADVPQIRAAINLDGEPISRDTRVFLNKPFMMIRSDISDASLKQQGITRDQMTQMVMQGEAAYKDVYFNPNPGYAVVLQGSTHATFESDVALIASAHPSFYALDVRGNIDGPTAISATCKLITEFFRVSFINDVSMAFNIQRGNSFPVVFAKYTNTTR